jgi:hypothetical protein
MKINRGRLNPLYDQYANEENRLTHSLLHTIGSSETLFSRFLKDVVGINTSTAGKEYEISTQKEPFFYGDDDQEKVESIPDAWIVDGSSEIGISIEVKGRRSSLKLSQLRSHLNRVKGYKHPYLLVITPDLRKPEKINQIVQNGRRHSTIVWHSWNEIYNWLVELPIRKSTQKTKELFLITAMREYLERRREVLGFQGIKFERGFNVSDAKIILNAEMEELGPIVKSLYRDLLKRRSAITTFSEESVWDCFGNQKGFTSDLHLTLSIHPNWHDISITIPNSAKKVWSRLRSIFSNVENEKKLLSILNILRKKVPHLFIEFNQRHFIAQRLGIRDGYIEFNIDNLGPPFKNRGSKVKEFPIWWKTIKEAILNRKGINGQVMFKSRFFFADGIVEKAQFIRKAEYTVKAYIPLYDFLRKTI